MLEMTLINCEMNLLLKLSECCVFTNAKESSALKVGINDTKFCIPIASLSSKRDNKLRQQLKSGSKRIIYSSKYIKNTS